MYDQLTVSPGARIHFVEYQEHQDLYIILWPHSCSWFAGVELWTYNGNTRCILFIIYHCHYNCLIYWFIVGSTHFRYYIFIVHVISTFAKINGGRNFAQRQYLGTRQNVAVRNRTNDDIGVRLIDIGKYNLYGWNFSSSSNTMALYLIASTI